MALFILLLVLGPLDQTALAQDPGCCSPAEDIAVTTFVSSEWRQPEPSFRGYQPPNYTVEFLGGSIRIGWELDGTQRASGDDPNVGINIRLIYSEMCWNPKENGPLDSFTVSYERRNDSQRTISDQLLVQQGDTLYIGDPPDFGFQTEIVGEQSPPGDWEKVTYDAVSPDRLRTTGLNTSLDGEAICFGFERNTSTSDEEESDVAVHSLRNFRVAFTPGQLTESAASETSPPTQPASPNTSEAGSSSSIDRSDETSPTGLVEDNDQGDEAAAESRSSDSSRIEEAPDDSTAGAPVDESEEGFPWGWAAVGTIIAGLALVVSAAQLAKGRSSG